MFVGHLYIFVGEVSVQVLCPFFDWIVCFLLLLSHMSSSFILDIRPLLEALLVNIFSHSDGWLSL